MQLHSTACSWVRCCTQQPAEPPAVLQWPPGGLSASSTAIQRRMQPSLNGAALLIVRCAALLVPCLRSASTAIKRYMQLCRIQQTESCLSPLDDAAQLVPLAEKWQENFVFTFVSGEAAAPAGSAHRALRAMLHLRFGGSGARSLHSA